MNDVFRITGFVQDKNLAKVKRMLSGLVYELQDEPVVNTQIKNGSIRARNGSTTEALLKGLKPGSKFHRKEAQAKLMAAGFSSSWTCNNLLFDLKTAGVLKMLGNGVYQVGRLPKPQRKE